MKAIIILIKFLIPVLLFGQGQRLGISPTAFQLTRQTPTGTASSFCSDGRARSIEYETKGRYKYFQSAKGIEVKVDGKDFPDGIEKLVRSNDILINTKSDKEVQFVLNPKSEYKSIDISIKEPNLLSDREGDFDIEDLWLDKLMTLKILPNGKASFKEANPYIKTFQKLNKLAETSGLLTKETQYMLDDLSNLVVDLKASQYLNSDFKKIDDVLEANTKFKADWGFSDSYSPFRDLKDLEILNKENDGAFVSLIVTTSTNAEYVVFDGLKKPLFRNTDELELAKFLGNTFKNNENIYINFVGIPTLAKKEAIISTLRIQPTVINKGIGINRFPSGFDNYLVFSKFSEIKLSKPLLKANVVVSKFKSKEYYSAKFKVKDRLYENAITEFQVQSVKKSVVNNFIVKINKLFSGVSKKISLIKFFNSFKKDLKIAMEIKNDDEFIIHMRDEFQDIRIVKILSAN